jgi:hypothetical protein
MDAIRDWGLTAERHVEVMANGNLRHGGDCRHAAACRRVLDLVGREGSLQLGLLEVEMRIGRWLN